MKSRTEISGSSGSFLSIEACDLLDEVKTLKEDGWRFCQACADRLDDGIEIIYTFENTAKLLNLKMVVAEEQTVDSITFVFWTAFDAELDIARDCGVKFKHVAEEHLHEFYDVADISYSAERIHGDMEALTEQRDYRQMVYVSERMTGTSSFGHSLGFCMAVEKASKIEVPARAEYLRIILMELSRVQSHLYWLSSVAERIGFESLAMGFLSVREPVLTMFDRISGNRIMLSLCKVGGMKKDISTQQLEDIHNTIENLRERIQTLTLLVKEDASICRRLEGIGVLDEKTAETFCGGPAARGSAVMTDARMDESWKIYESLGFVPIIEEGCDGLARCKVAVEEIYHSFTLIENAINEIPDGEICTEVKTLSAGEAAVRLEQPDGQAVYYVKTTDSDYIRKFRVSMPTDTNLLAYVRAMKASDPIDRPLTSLTMDPCRNNVEW